MARFLKDKQAALGKAPGSAVFIGTQKTEAITMHSFEYDADSITESDPETVEELTTAEDKVTWININGLHDARFIRKAGEKLGVHPLVIEDILDTGQRPKIELYDDYLFLVLKMMYVNDEKRIVNEQLSLVLGKGFVLTFQERPGDLFDPVRKRIREKKGRIRQMKSDYLAYALIDSVLDSCFTIIESMGEKIEDIEDEIFDHFDKSILSTINGYKREMNYLRKTIRPVRDSLLKLNALETPLIESSTAPYLNDLLDLSTQTRDIIDTYRVMLSDHLEIYNSEVNNRLNEIMKILTIFSAVFIPLTFIAGIYGTNFEYLPELKYRYSYFIFWGVLIFVALGMVLFFKKKKWL